MNRICIFLTTFLIALALPTLVFWVGLIGRYPVSRIEIYEEEFENGFYLQDFQPMMLQGIYKKKKGPCFCDIF